MTLLLQRHNCYQEDQWYRWTSSTIPFVKELNRNFKAVSYIPPWSCSIYLLFNLILVCFLFLGYWRTVTLLDKYLTIFPTLRIWRHCKQMKSRSAVHETVTILINSYLRFVGRDLSFNKLPGVIPSFAHAEKLRFL